MRLALFTSNHLRHKYIASQLANYCDLQLIITEEKSPFIEKSLQYDLKDQKLLDTHFKERSETEHSFFKQFTSFPDSVKKIELPYKGIASKETLDTLFVHDIEAIALFGTSIIPSFILDAYPEKVVNLHLGLSPYYKGSGTNFFPIVHGEFESLGATFHLAIPEVDAGAILHQLRLDDLNPEDTIHTLGNKIIKKAGFVYPRVINAYFKGSIKPVPQQPYEQQKVYRVKDFTPEMLRKAHRTLQEEGIALYLKNMLSRKQKQPIITYLDA